MNDKELCKELRRIATLDEHCCMGCGYEKRCSLHGCAVNQMMLLHKCTKEVAEQKQRKLERLKKRLTDGEAET